MVKNIISSRNTDYSIFLQCDCGQEVLWLYYFHGTMTCDEIIGLNFIGYFRSEKDYARRYFAFTYNTFAKLIETLKLFQTQNSGEEMLYDRGAYLVIEKDDRGFYSISTYHNSREMRVKHSIWSVDIREPQVTEFIVELEKMQEVIDKYNDLGGMYVTTDDK